MTYTVQQTRFMFPWLMRDPVTWLMPLGTLSERACFAWGEL